MKDIGSLPQVVYDTKVIESKHFSSKLIKNITMKEGSSKTAASPSWMGVKGLIRSENQGVNESSVLDRVNILSPIAEAHNENSPPESKFIITMRDVKEHLNAN